MTTNSQELVARALSELAQKGRKYEHGFFDFPFGRVRYVDPITLGIEYKEIFTDGIYDFTTERKRPFIVDCGANIGLSVIRTKMCHPLSDILTFEADPAIFATLRSNLAVLGLGDIEAECAAVATFDGHARFCIEGAEGGHLAKDGQIEVPAVRLSKRLNRHVDLLKLDIEGAEWDVLMDVIDSDAIRNVQNLIVEFHGWKSEGRKLGIILTGLSKHGFSTTFPWSFCEPGLFGPAELTPFRYARDAKFILFLHAWRELSERP